MTVFSRLRSIGSFRFWVGYRLEVPRTTEAGPDPSSCFGIEFDALALLGTGMQHGASGAHGAPCD